MEKLPNILLAIAKVAVFGLALLCSAYSLNAWVNYHAASRHDKHVSYDTGLPATIVLWTIFYTLTLI